MLVLTRKQNQEIFIGDNIKITVLKTKGNTVRLGIDAPRDVNVVRGELTRHQTDSQSIQELDTPQVAEFTVVFNNSAEPQAARVDVIPFQQPNNESAAKDGETDSGSKARRSPDQTQNSNSESVRSIQFRGNLPAQLQHNRLQEIVNKLTANPEGSSI